MGFQVAPASSDRNAPAAEMAMTMRSGCARSSRMVCRHMPPAPGIQPAAVALVRRPGSSVQVAPPSVVRKSAASSTPARQVSGSVSEGSRCHTRAKAQECGVPSYH